MDEPQINFRMSVSLFHCGACFRPLKPPTFKRFACSVRPGTACAAPAATATARSATAPRTYAACDGEDAFLQDAKLPCAYKEFGCESYVVYHKEADHLRACPWAPCSCPDHGCRVFTSPARLLEHLGGRHSWPVTGVSYGKPCKLPVPPPQGWHVLVGGEDRCVFLVSASALGAATAVSLVCVRANGDAAAAGAPQFECRIWVEAPGASGSTAMIASTVRSSSLSRGFVAADQDMFLAVPPELLHGASGETPILSVRINKVRDAADSSTRAAARSSRRLQ
ncbi:hypothetical protein PVAP13_5KG122800 [Panicum virgatum]|uniref:SIAH-type domain-containing protein n=2 Tax=Panicum virgatum TaxID=38727 RepID=A0A8T0SGD7_PANVG|nr:hypothetical protein PVAP13_5KG122800 [Panicum virgatum]